MSIDKFYEIVTGKPNSFYEMCMALPDAIKKLLDESDALKVPKDSVFSELKSKAVEMPFELALFMLGFETYSGFKDVIPITESARFKLKP